MKSAIIRTRLPSLTVCQETVCRRAWLENSRRSGSWTIGGDAVFCCASFMVFDLRVFPVLAETINKTIFHHLQTHTGLL
jgi:hypothetical protein